jgi:hypothetical protein
MANPAIPVRFTTVSLEDTVMRLLNAFRFLTGPTVTLDVHEDGERIVFECHGLGNCEKALAKRLKKWLRDNPERDVHQKSLVYRNGLRKGRAVMTIFTMKRK